MARDFQQQAYFDRRVPYGTFEYVTVTFNAVDDADTDIPITLAPAVPDDVRWEVVNWELTSPPGVPPVVYRDGQAGRRAWTSTVIYLRCTEGGARARLRLFLE